MRRWAYMRKRTKVSYISLELLVNNAADMIVTSLNFFCQKILVDASLLVTLFRGSFCGEGTQNRVSTTSYFPNSSCQSLLGHNCWYECLSYIYV